MKRFFSIQEQNNRNSINSSASDTERPLRVGKIIEFKGKSTFYPVSYQGNFIETFSDLVSNDLENLEEEKETNT